MKFLFGKERSFTFKDVIIDEKTGYPIIVDGVEVGGILVDRMEKGNKWKVIRVLGIEIYPEHRKKGIAKRVLKFFLKKNTGMIGAITEEGNKGFWKKMGAECMSIPLEAFTPRQLETMHTKEPLFFCITQDKSLRDEMFEMMKTSWDEIMKIRKDLKLEDRYVESPGSTAPLKPNYKLDDFQDGFFPHTLCLYGAMCGECRGHLKVKNK